MSGEEKKKLSPTAGAARQASDDVWEKKRQERARRAEAAAAGADGDQEGGELFMLLLLLVTASSPLPLHGSRRCAQRGLTAVHLGVLSQAALVGTLYVGYLRYTWAFVRPCSASLTPSKRLPLLRLPAYLRSPAAHCPLLLLLLLRRRRRLSPVDSPPRWRGVVRRRSCRLWRGRGIRPRWRFC
jgi:hypothetical protein